MISILKLYTKIFIIFNVGIHFPSSDAGLHEMNIKINFLIKNIKNKTEFKQDKFYTTRYDVKRKTTFVHNKQNLYQTFSNWISSWGAKKKDVHKRKTNISLLGQYGCWCNFLTQDDYNDRILYNNFGEANMTVLNRFPYITKDLMDIYCRNLERGYNCLQIDSIESKSPIYCNPKSVSYTPSLLQTNLQLITEFCESNNINTCAQKACILEGQFISNIFRMFINKQKVHRHYRHNDRGTPTKFNYGECKAELEKTPKLSNGRIVAIKAVIDNGKSINESKNIIEGKDIKDRDLVKAEMYSCCGTFPNKVPFPTGDSPNLKIRACCGNKIYQTEIFNCCNDNNGYKLRVEQCWS